MSDCVAESVKRRPISRFASNTVFVGFIAHWFLAASPIIRSESVNATNDGVVRLPWSLAMISTRSFCQMPTHEYVVPRSMPTAAPSTLESLPMFGWLSAAARARAVRCALLGVVGRGDAGGRRRARAAPEERKGRRRGFVREDSAR